MFSPDALSPVLGIQAPLSREAHPFRRGGMRPHGVKNFLFSPGRVRPVERRCCGLHALLCIRWSRLLVRSGCTDAIVDFCVSSSVPHHTHEFRGEGRPNILRAPRQKPPRQAQLVFKLVARYCTLYRCCSLRSFVTGLRCGRH